MPREPSYFCPQCAALMKPSAASSAWQCRNRHRFTQPRPLSDDPRILLAYDASGVGRTFRPVGTPAPTPGKQPRYDRTE